MAEATGGVPEAIASISTMPKLSPAREGAQSRSASPRAAHSSSSLTFPRVSIRASRSGSAMPRATSSGSAPITVSFAGTCSTSAWKADSSTGRPLRSSARPTNSSRSSSDGVLGPAWAASTSTPLGTIT